MNDTKVNDIYVDGSGALWRCISTWGEPVVQFEAVEPNPANPMKPHSRKIGGVSGSMWAGWKRIHRKGE